MAHRNRLPVVSLLLASVVCSQDLLMNSGHSQTAEQILDAFVRSERDSMSADPTKANPDIAPFALMSRLTYCGVGDRASGNWEMITALNKNKSPEENIAFASAMGLASTSIIQSICGSRNESIQRQQQGSGDPLVPSARSPHGGGRSEPGLMAFATNPADVPGYATMVRFKGMFTESIAPRQLTVLPGYDRDRTQTIQSIPEQIIQLQMKGLPPDRQKELSQLPPDERAKAVQDYWLAHQPASKSEGIAAAQMYNLPKEKQEEFGRLPPGEREKAVQAYWQAWAAQHMGPHGVEMPTQDGQSIQDMAWQWTRAMGPQSVAPSSPLAFVTMLRPSEAFVDIYKYKHRAQVGDPFGAEHYVMVISAAGRPSRLVQLGPAKPLDSAVVSFFDDLQGAGDVRASWQYLKKLIVQPILAELPAGTKKIFLSPDSSFALVPFSSLLLDMGSALEVSVTPSAYDFVRLRSAPAMPATGKALLIGALNYGTGSEFKALDSAGEISAVAKLTADAQMQPIVLSGSQVTKSKVIDEIRDAQYLHFATHGFWSATNSANPSDAFRAAGVALSLANSGIANSILTAEDIVHLNLSKVQLVVLSACKSAQGRPVDGQGLLGFQTAFQAAGVRSSLVSLWNVPDEATGAFMQAFYGAILRAGRSKADAMRDAQMKLRNDRVFNDPINWAGWVLIGEAW
jgi:hypothetical protein